ncbi:MAG TPA: sialidase family protein [Planctomycetaceae bacterium]|nr:sialidase family protein [Planctomycetaceae bacterium]
MPRPLSRRDWLTTTTTALSAACWWPAHLFANDAAIKIEETRVISWKPPLYHGWPTLTRRQNGELWLVFSGGRESHVCPFGRLEAMRSKDGGKTWGWPQVLYDGPSDDRDAGIVETAKGTLLVTNFTSLAYEPLLTKAEAAKPGEPGAFPELQLREWQAVHNRLTAEERKAELGCWMFRSTDGGVNWSARYRVPLNSPHGPVSLKNGDLIYPGVDLWGPGRKVGVCVSKDDGVTWTYLADIPVRPGDKSADYHELHAVEAADGTILCHIRNHSAANKGETLQCESTDGGKTWSTPHSIGVWGLPSHLLRLRDGRLMMSYGYRRPPFGNQVRLSSNHGKTWSEPLTISGDGVGGDLGYPSTVEVEPNRFVTVWYEKLKESPLAQLRQARWSLKG